jgi:hypothetical protein
VVCCQVTHSDAGSHALSLVLGIPALAGRPPGTNCRVYVVDVLSPRKHCVEPVGVAAVQSIPNWLAPMIRPLASSNIIPYGITGEREVT